MTGGVVYGVFRNSDFIEGSGHMVLDKLFLSQTDAEEYIRFRPGIMGIPNTGSDSSWKIDCIDIHTDLKGLELYGREEEIKKERDKILSKLTKYEKELLGLEE